MHLFNLFTKVMGRRLEGEEGGDETFGWENHAWTRENEVIIAEFLLVFFILLVATLYLQYFVGKIWKLHWLPESGATMLFGMLIGGIIRLSGASTEDKDSGASMLGFDSTLFFLGFLPPIIFNAGYMLNRRLFFANMGGIVALAFLGTAFSTILVGLGLWGLGKGGLSHEISLLETICFGSLISATDPVSTLAVFTELRVDPTLFYLVFGESVMNDAVAITLFRTTGKYVGLEIGPEEGVVAFLDFVISFVGSVVIGYGLGLISAWMFKKVDMNHHNHILVSIFVGSVYIPFFLAETLQLSGIVTILFSAITAKRYSNRNMDAEAKHQCAFVFEIMAYLSETAVFLYLGLNVFAKANSDAYKWGFIFWTFLIIIVGRGLHVYPLLGLVNRYRTKRAKLKNREPVLISQNTKHMVFFSGLRGAVAYACANIFPDEKGNREVIVTTTMIIALVTILLKGGFTISMLDILNIEKGVDAQPFADKLKVTAKPYRFLLWEQKNIYPWIIRNFNPATDMDISAERVDMGHHGEDWDHTVPNSDLDGDVEMQDESGRLVGGYGNSSDL